jgi:hypothetical protein
MNPKRLKCHEVDRSISRRWLGVLNVTLRTRDFTSSWCWSQLVKGVFVACPLLVGQLIQGDFRGCALRSDCQRLCRLLSHSRSALQILMNIRSRTTVRHYAHVVLNTV